MKVTKDEDQAQRTWTNNKKKKEQGLERKMKERSKKLGPRKRKALTILLDKINIVVDKNPARLDWPHLINVIFCLTFFNSFLNFQNGLSRV